MSGDFDISIEFTSRTHSDPGNLGDGSRWGKFGIMARAVRERCSRFTMLQDHLPNLVDTTRRAGRTVFGGGCGNMYEDRVQEVDNFHRPSSGSRAGGTSSRTGTPNTLPAGSHERCQLDPGRLG